MSVNDEKKAKRKADDEAGVVAAIAAMDEPDRSIGKQLHSIIKANAPMLFPKTWYGMPAYANEYGKTVCFFRDRKKFNERYMTLGFNDLAKLDNGNIWPLNYAITKLTAVDEEKIAAIVKKAVQ